MSEVEEKKEILTKKQARIDKAKRMWYRFSRNKMSVVGLVGVILVILIAIFQDVIAPYPEHAQAYKMCIRDRNSFFLVRVLWDLRL